MSIWLRPLVLIGIATCLAWFLHSGGLPEAAWGVVAVTALAIAANQLRHVARLARWVAHGLPLDPVEDAAGQPAPASPAPHGSGPWNDIFARLYRHERAMTRALGSASRALAGFRSAAQALPDGVVALDAQLRIDWFNALAQVHLGLNPATDRGQSIANLLRHPEFVAYAASGQWAEPIVLRAAPDNERILQIRLVAYGADQRLLLTRDVTQLEKLETTRRDFVANVSHELRTPLTVLAGFVETLRELPAHAIPPPQQQHYLALMAEQSDRMQAIVTDLLTLSTLESSPVAEARPVRVAELLARVRDQVEALSRGRHRFEWDVAPGLDLLGAEDEIASAFTNLLSNAVRYTPDGGTISARWAADPAGARFSVTDTGIGIEARYIPRLTERFYRVDRSRSRESGGTGLGLAIVKYVLLRHEARLEIQSESGKGSTFAAIFPERRIAIRDPAQGADASRRGT